METLKGLEPDGFAQMLKGLEPDGMGQAAAPAPVPAMKKASAPPPKLEGQVFVLYPVYIDSTKNSPDA